MKDNRRNFLRLLDANWPKLSDALKKSLSDIKQDVSLKDLERALEEQDVDKVLRVLGLDQTTLSPLSEAMRDAVKAGGVYQMTSVRKASGGRVRIGFDIGAEEAESWARSQSSRRITSITDQTRETVRQKISESLKNGQNPREAALDLVGRMKNGRRTGGIIGLDNSQIEYVKSARSELFDLDNAENYFSRTRRDRRYDAMVRKHIDSGGKTLSRKKLNEIAGRYEDRLITTRAESIARTESLTALNGGRHLSMKQLSDSGTILPQNMKKTWDATGDSKTRDEHQAAEGQTVLYTEPFIVGGYKLMYPGDNTEAPASMIVRCRCYMSIEIDWIAEAERDQDRLA